MDELRDSINDVNFDDASYEPGMKLREYLTNHLKDRVSRRQLLKAGGLTGLSLSALWALACQPAAPAPTPTKPAVVAAPTPTAPAAPTPTKPPAPTPTPEAKIGKALIGKLEGPEIITDAAKFPKAFKEAPELADLVKAGKLPAVKERVGEEPLVLKPVHEIGKYGGVWRRGFTGPADFHNGTRSAGVDSLLYYDYSLTKVVPNIAKGWEVTDGGKTITVFLRRGMKWSDGQPFTADDFQFWYQELYLIKDFNPTPIAELTLGGKPATMERVDAYTVRYRFPEPNYMFADILAGPGALGGQTTRGRDGLGGYAPTHYVKQFHPKYVSKEELDKKVKDAKFDNWVTLLKSKMAWHLNPELPVVTAWKTTTGANTPVWTLERNPYSIWVDTEGNQLPYIDKITMTLAENLEVLNLRAIAGEYDYQARHLDMGKIPVFLANQEKGGYKLRLDPAGWGADGGFDVNLAYAADPEIAKWLNNADFRRALALGIERDQLNETFFLGLGTPGSAAPDETNKYSPGPEWRTKWATYDPKKANEMLDKIGLDKKDAEGFRLRTDGKGRLRIEVLPFAAQFIPFTQICEMIREHWKKIGIDLIVKEVERTLGERMLLNGEQQLFPWFNDDTIEPFLPSKLFPHGGTRDAIGRVYGQWYVSGGKLGKEPPPSIAKVQEMYTKGQTVPEAERIKLGQEMWKIALEEVWTIGTVGLSPASVGVRVAKVKLGNVATRVENSWNGRSPATSRLMTLFWKS